MKKIAVNLLAIIAVVAFVTSCSEDNSVEKFSPLGVEQDKANIEEEGIELVGDLKTLSETDFATASFNMNQLLDSQTELASNKLIEAMALLGTSMANEEPLQDQMTILKEISLDEQGLLSQLWDEGCGVWDWDATQKTFVHSSTEGAAATYHFPASAAAESNNATLVLSDFKAGQRVEMNGKTIELVETFNAEMTINEELIGTLAVSNTFDANGIPQSVNITFSPLPFIFEMELKNTNNEEASWRYAFKEDKRIIVEHILSVKGSVTTESINTVETTLQIENIVVHGVVDGDALAKEIQTIMENYGGQGEDGGFEMPETNEAAALAELAKAINDHTNLELKYADSGNLIAKVEAVVTDDNGHKDIDLLFIFADDSKVDAETYFADSMKRFEDELTKFITEMEGKMGIQ